MTVDWNSSETHLLLNPRMPGPQREVLERAAAAVQERAHVLIASSGSTGEPRLVALSKEAMLASARAVNRHLQAAANDVWCRVLPTFHVGGLAIHARAFVNGARVVSAPWQAGDFVSLCERERVSLSALVPAQVIDLIRGAFRAPHSLRAIVVGGGALTPDTHAAARRLGWPLLPSYGMTECCSQVATATPDSPELIVLDHLQVRSESDGRLEIRGASLLTGYVDATGRLHDPKRDGWLLTSDLGSVQGRSLSVVGRVDDVVKIGGELVSVARLEAVLESVRGEDDAALVVLEDARLGAVIHLAATGREQAIVDAFNGQVLPFERIRRAHAFGRIPRTPLGKVRRAELRKAVERRLADEAGNRSKREE